MANYAQLYLKNLVYNFTYYINEIPDEMFNEVWSLMEKNDNPEYRIILGDQDEILGQSFIKIERK